MLSKQNLKYKTLLLLSMFFLFSSSIADDTTAVDAMEKTEKPFVYIFEVKKDISKPALRITSTALDEAKRLGASYVIMHFNTYGGLVNIADSIRTKILNFDIPILVFIDNQAISAGALISIACDSIYIRPGGSIGAATVVSQSGEAVPDKYQSFMRSTMRATAEAHGKDTIINGNDTIFEWHRNPKIAEAMVDPKLEVKDISPEGQVLTLTADEALNVGYAEGLADNIDEVIELAGLQDLDVRYYKPDGTEKLIGFFLSPAVQGVLILMIFGGLYFEFQTPGVGFPLGIAVLGAILYFAPLYLEGMAENWELLLFLAGVVLIAVEIFVVPGFGIAGVAGILCMLAGLTFSLVDKVVFEFDGTYAFNAITRALGQVVISLGLALIMVIVLARRAGKANWFSGIALETVQESSAGYVSTSIHEKNLIGKEGEAYTVLRPGGKVIIDDNIYDAIAEVGFIEKGEPVKVIKDEAGQIYVIRKA